MKFTENDLELLFYHNWIDHFIKQIWLFLFYKENKLCCQEVKMDQSRRLIDLSALVVDLRDLLRKDAVVSKDGLCWLLRQRILKPEC